MRDIFLANLFERETTTPTKGDIQQLLTLGTSCWATYVLVFEYMKRLSVSYIYPNVPGFKCFKQEYFNLHDPNDGIKILMLKCDDTGNYLDALQRRLCDVLLSSEEDPERNRVLQFIKHRVLQFIKHFSNCAYPGITLITGIINQASSYLKFMSKVQFTNALTMIENFTNPELFEKIHIESVIELIYANAKNLILTHAPSLSLPIRNIHALKPAIISVNLSLRLIFYLFQNDLLKTIDNIMESILSNSLQICDEDVRKNVWALIYIILVDKDLKITNVELIELICYKAKNLFYYDQEKSCLLPISVLTTFLEDDLIKNKDILDDQTCKLICDRLNEILRSNSIQRQQKLFCDAALWVFDTLNRAHLLKNPTKTEVINAFCSTASEFLQSEDTIEEGQLIIDHLNKAGLINVVLKKIPLES